MSDEEISGAIELSKEALGLKSDITKTETSNPLSDINDLLKNINGIINSDVGKHFMSRLGLQQTQTTQQNQYIPPSQAQPEKKGMMIDTDSIFSMMLNGIDFVTQKNVNDKGENVTAKEIKEFFSKNEKELKEELRGVLGC